MDCSAQGDEQGRGVGPAQDIIHCTPHLDLPSDAVINHQNKDTKQLVEGCSVKDLETTPHLVNHQDKQEIIRPAQDGGHTPVQEKYTSRLP